MATYVMVYVNNPAGGEPTSSMDDWMAWLGGLGDAVKDIGTPFAGSISVRADGSTGAAESGLGGYSIIEADSLEAAAGAASGCPILVDGGRVEVFETVAM